MMGVVYVVQLAGAMYDNIKTYKDLAKAERKQKESKDKPEKIRISFE